MTVAPNGAPIRLEDEEKIALLRAALHTMRGKVAGLPDRQHIDHVLWLTSGHPHT